MKLARSLMMMIALTTAGTAYAAPDAKPVAPTDSTVSQADADKFIAFLNKLADKVVADKDSCPTMATDINALIDGNKDLLAMAKQAKASGKQMPKDMRDKVGPVLQRLGGGMQKCGKDSQVQAAIQRLQLK